MSSFEKPNGSDFYLPENSEGIPGGNLVGTTGGTPDGIPIGNQGGTSGGSTTKIKLNKPKETIKHSLWGSFCRRNPATPVISATSCKYYHENAVKNQNKAQPGSVFRENSDYGRTDSVEFLRQKCQ